MTEADDLITQIRHRYIGSERAGIEEIIRVFFAKRSKMPDVHPEVFKCSCGFVGSEVKIVGELFDTTNRTSFEGWKCPKCRKLWVFMPSEQAGESDA